MKEALELPITTWHPTETHQKLGGEEAAQEKKRDRKGRRCMVVGRTKKGRRRDGDRVRQNEKEREAA